MEDDLSAQGTVQLLAQTGTDVFKVGQNIILYVWDHVCHDLRAGLQPLRGLWHR